MPTSQSFVKVLLILCRLQQQKRKDCFQHLYDYIFNNDLISVHSYLNEFHDEVDEDSSAILIRISHGV